MHTYIHIYTNTHNMQKRKHTDANRPNHCRNTANDQPIGMLKKCALTYMGLSTVVIYSCDQEQAGTSLIMRWAQCPAHSPPGATRCHQGNQHHHRLHHHQVGWGTLLHQDNQHHHITITITINHHHHHHNQPSQPTLYQNGVNAQRGPP